ncbi:phosphatase domain-containing protein [Polyangium aurulentum]|uniref:phosphatase domain-containing protein n=1 Tax=Polyangium aurulentum TaxID=2567896 RepID=UPI0010ADB744|nr:phosphatase domain-containing protein [Polyangium aurulentum]UQA58317.1 hypothetical protein E8A73_044915 [Polyangium aurulentum]
MDNPSQSTPEQLPGATEKVEAIRALMRGHTGREDERRILALLEQSSAEELSFVLVTLDLRALVGDVDDRLFGPDNRTALLRLLTVTRLGDLDIPARAALVRSLQKGVTSGIFERAVRDVLVGTRGPDLLRLKASIDAGGSRHDLHALLFCDLDDEALREEILAHFAAEAKVPSPEIKILSDIDDTFYANWKDRRYPPKTVYPGVLAFYAELDRGPGEVPGRMGDLVFVTARPGDRTGFVEDATHAALLGRGAPPSTILAGSFRRILTNSAIAAKKLENFLEYRRVYPEHGFVFVGDSGQGDIAFGEGMIAAAPAAVRGVFIHDVVATPEARREELRGRDVWLFDTYAGAAAIALKRGLISAEGAHRVAEAASAELPKIAFSSEEARAAREAELSRDLEHLSGLTGHAG